MSTENALFRAMRPLAETLLIQRLRRGEAIDNAQIVEEVLDRFRPIVSLGELAPALAARLLHLLESADPRAVEKMIANGSE
jgi:hypothetical protein